MEVQGTVRAVFAGASGTGKTTLVRSAAAEFGLEINPVGSRSTALEMGFPNPYSVDKALLATYEWAIEEGMNPVTAASLAMGDWNENSGGSCRSLFQKRLQESKIAWEREHRRFVSDRSTLDDLVYTCLHTAGRVDDEFIERAKQHAKTYDVIFVTPMESFFDPSGDPMRVQERAYHVAFEAMLRGFIELFELPQEQVVFIHSRGLRARTELVNRTLKHLVG